MISLLVKKKILALQIFVFKKIILSNNAWIIFDKAGLEGFGTNLIRLYFPIYYNKKKNKDSFSAPIEKDISKLFDEALLDNNYDQKIINAITFIHQIPLDEQHKTKPYLDNYYYGILDAAVLSAMMETHMPSKIIEIGSGISTRYMKLFKDLLKLDTQIVCIDPFPRAEIDDVADIIIREPLEDVLEEENIDLKSGDILFMDGSHYMFQGNDTLTFFFKCLPVIPSGVIIHIHDIYLPEDYNKGVSQQLWSEQYLLAAMLTSGMKGYEVLYPTYYASKTNEQISNCLSSIEKEMQNRNFKLRNDHSTGYSFWMKKT